MEKLSFGGVAALWDEAQRLGLHEIIDKVIPQRSNREISIGMYLWVGVSNRV